MRRKYLCGIALILLSLSTVISAQTVDPYILSLTDASGGTGVPLGIDVFLESNAGQVQGWSFGVCHDDEVLEYVGAIEGPATLTAKNGAPADFTMVNEVVGGMTMGTVICFTACATLPQGMYELLEISYVPIASAGTSTSVSFCSTLGFPVIHTVVVVNGASQIPTQISGTIDVVSPNDLVIGTAYGPPGLTVSVPVRLTSVVPVDGIQVAFTFDPAVLTLVSVDPVGPALNADFFALPAGLAPGEVGFGLVMDISPPLDNQLPSGDDIQILDARFEIAPGALAPLTSTLAFAPSVGAPPPQHHAGLGSDAGIAESLRRFRRGRRLPAVRPWGLQPRPNREHRGRDHFALLPLRRNRLSDLPRRLRCERRCVPRYGGPDHDLLVPVLRGTTPSSPFSRGGNRPDPRRRDRM